MTTQRDRSPDTDRWMYFGSPEEEDVTKCPSRVIKLEPSVSMSFPRAAGIGMTHLSLPIKYYTGNIRNHQLVLAE